MRNGTLWRRAGKSTDDRCSQPFDGFSGEVMCWSVGKHEWAAGSREVSSSQAGTNVNWNQPKRISR